MAHNLKEPWRRMIHHVNDSERLSGRKMLQITCGGATAGGVLYSLDPLERLPVPIALAIGGVGGLLVGAGGTGLWPLKVPVIIGPPSVPIPAKLLLLPWLLALFWRGISF